MTKKKQTSNNKNQNKLALIPSECPLVTKQLDFILSRTPKEHIYKRPAKGGGEWEYVTGAYVKKRLNYIFGWLWDFEVKEHGREGNTLWVLGRLTIKDKENRPMIVKEQFGRADIKFKRGSKDPVDFGNDLKAASTDALKKCASELGIARDIYAKEEFKEIRQVDKGFKAEKIEDIEDIKEGEVIETPKLDELKSMLKGSTDKQKLADLKKRTGITPEDLDLTEKHASHLIAELLQAETK